MEEAVAFVSLSLDHALSEYHPLSETSARLVSKRNLEGNLSCKYALSAPSSPRTSHPCTVSRERTREFQYLLAFSVLFCSASPHTEKILNTNPSLTSFFIHSSQLLLNLVARREESLPSLITHLLLPHPTRHVHTPQRLTLTRRRLPRPFPLSPGRIHGLLWW